jgi:hypothetical protein
MRRSRQDPRIGKLRRLIAHPATSAEERAAAVAALDRLTAAAPADVPAPAPDPQAAPDPPEIANEWNPGPWIGEKTLDNAWAGD